MNTTADNSPSWRRFPRRVWRFVLHTVRAFLAGVGVFTLIALGFALTVDLEEPTDDIPVLLIWLAAAGLVAVIVRVSYRRVAPKRALEMPAGSWAEAVSTSTFVLASLIHELLALRRFGSQEWYQACEMLSVYSDDELTEVQAGALLALVRHRKHVAVNEKAVKRLPLETRLGVLRFRLEITLNNGSSADDDTALRVFALRLGISDDVRETLQATMLTVSEETADALAVLGLGSAATTADIHRAYRELTRFWHPDNATKPNRQEAVERTAEINAAYEHLIGKHD